MSLVRRLWSLLAGRGGGMAVACLCVVMAVGPQPIAAQSTSLSGSVRDEVGRPIRDALIVVDPDSLSLRARTDAEGRFRIGNVPSGRFEVRVVRIG